MAFLSKGSSVKYSQLSQEVSDDEDEEDDVLYVSENGNFSSNTASNLKNNNKSHESIELHEIHSGPSRSRAKKQDQGVSIEYGNALSRTRIVCFLGTMLLAVGIAVIFVVVIPMLSRKQGKVKGHFGMTNWKTPPNDTQWIKTFDDMLSESCVRLVDVDDDGRMDILFGGLMIAFDADAFHTKADIKRYCLDNGKKPLCTSKIVALRGYDGKVLYEIPTESAPFELNCQGIDINQDGKDDCIATGRMGTIVAFNSKNGDVFWIGDETAIEGAWNTFGVTILPDLDGDGIPEVLLPHGGDPKYGPNEHDRPPGRLILLSGKTGKMIGRWLDMPDKHETYMTAVLHERKDGSLHILFGSGSFYGISVPDFYRYVLASDSSVQFPSLKHGSYSPWGPYKPGLYGIQEIYKSSLQGVMVPPLLVDMNTDGVKDILMVAYDGLIRLYDGETLNTMWQTEYSGFESYSSPSPGYFNDDDTLDFMMNFCFGAWPHYNWTWTVILDGRDGSRLWSTVSGRMAMSSPLTVRTSERNRDAFLFRLQGRQGKDLKPFMKAYFGAAAPPSDRKRRHGDDNEKGGNDHDDDDDGDEDDPTNTDAIENFDGDDDKGPCYKNNEVFTTEMFMIDRTTSDAPVLVESMPTQMVLYNLTAEEEKVIMEKLQSYIVDNREKSHTGHTIKRRHGGGSKTKVNIGHESQWRMNGSLCATIAVDERNTGAIGDIDGDGRMDVVNLYTFVGIQRDGRGNFAKMKQRTIISVQSLNTVLRRGTRIPFKATKGDGMQSIHRKKVTEKSLTLMEMLPQKLQPWSAYLGNKADSVFP